MSLEHFCWLLAIGYKARLTGQGSQNGLNVPKPRMTSPLFTSFSGGFKWPRGYEYEYSVGTWRCRFRMNCPGCPRRTQNQNPMGTEPQWVTALCGYTDGETLLGPLYGMILKTTGHPPHWLWCHLEPRLHVPGHAYLSLDGISLFSSG